MITHFSKKQVVAIVVGVAALVALVVGIVLIVKARKAKSTTIAPHIKREINPANPLRSYVERYVPINMKLERVNYDPNVVEIIPTSSDQDLSQIPPPNTFLIDSTPMGSS
jgi:hypothetical protein